MAQDWSYDKLFKTALSYEQSRKAADAINTATEEVNKVQLAGRYSGRRPPPTARQQSNRGKPGATGASVPTALHTTDHTNLADALRPLRTAWHAKRGATLPGQKTVPARPHRQ